MSVEQTLDYVWICASLEHHENARSSISAGVVLDVGDLGDLAILGRVDDMKLVRGTNVYPRAVEAVVREHSEVEEFQIILSRRDDVQDEITVKVELKPDQADQWGRLEGQLGKDLADAHEGLRFNVELAAEGELPRFELKAKRLQDLRPQY